MVIGITGTDGAGKGAVADYLIEQKGFIHYSSRALIIEEVEKRGLEPNRDNLRIVANDMRRQQGNDVMVTVAYQKIAAEDVEDAVIESIRTTAETETLKANGGVLIAVDADQHLRYERIVGRGSESDNISFAKFQEQEAIEMNDPDPNGMQKAKVMAMADYTILNEGSLEELHNKIEKVLQLMDS